MLGEPQSSQNSSLQLLPVVGVQSTSYRVVNFLVLGDDDGDAAEQTQRGPASDWVVRVDNCENSADELVHVDNLVQVATGLLADPEHAHALEIGPGDEESHETELVSLGHIDFFKIEFIKKFISS